MAILYATTAEGLSLQLYGLDLLLVPVDGAKGQGGLSEVRAGLLFRPARLSGRFRLRLRDGRSTRGR